MKISAIKFLSSCIVVGVFISGCSSNEASLNYAKQHNLLQNPDYKNGAHIQCVTDGGLNTVMMTANIMAYYDKFVRTECIQDALSSHIQGYYYTCINNMKEENAIIALQANENKPLVKVTLREYDGYYPIKKDGSGVVNLGTFAYEKMTDNHTIVYSMDAGSIINNGVQRYMATTGQCRPLP